MLATITSKGQVTIPKEIRSLLNIKTNDKVDFLIENGKAVIVPLKTLRELRGAVPASGPGDFAVEREQAKKAVAARMIEETL